MVKWDGCQHVKKIATQQTCAERRSINTEVFPSCRKADSERQLTLSETIGNHLIYQWLRYSSLELNLNSHENVFKIVVMNFNRFQTKRLTLCLEKDTDFIVLDVYEFVFEI